MWLAQIQYLIHFCFAMLFIRGVSADTILDDPKFRKFHPNTQERIRKFLSVTSANYDMFAECIAGKNVTKNLYLVKWNFGMVGAEIMTPEEDGDDPLTGVPYRRQNGSVVLKCLRESGIKATVMTSDGYGVGDPRTRGVNTDGWVEFNREGFDSVFNGQVIIPPEEAGPSEQAVHALSELLAVQHQPPRNSWALISIWSSALMVALLVSMRFKITGGRFVFSINHINCQGDTLNDEWKASSLMNGGTPAASTNYTYIYRLL